MLEWVAQVPKVLERTVFFFSLTYVQSELEGSISAPVYDSASDKSHSLIFASWLSYGLWCCVSNLPTSEPSVCSTGKISGAYKAVNSALTAKTFDTRV